ncbi:uncharacterized protein LOC125949156 [Anopheles darlingi]|uniref:uncharacterized protein LOC125949156 n=1 Tax=Anopheles darlingi TaxID=43151 RepID=UPI002100177F|nr:uncharacterized protein LOC125949156 [Anopheles darlingi]
MGGCRCTFRSCEHGTASRPDLHYFRYPVKDPERLSAWIKNSQRAEFIKLPQDKLSNKVVCQEHFERKMFMNYLRERLTRTAIPRLMPVPGEDTRINVETGDIVGPDVDEGQTRKPEIVTPYTCKQREQRPSLELTISTKEEQPQETMPTPPLKKMKILNPEILVSKRKDSPGTVVRNGMQPPGRIIIHKPHETVLLNKMVSKRTLDSGSSEQRIINSPKLAANVTHCVLKEEIVTIQDEPVFSPVAAEQNFDDVDNDSDTGEVISTTEVATTQTTSTPTAESAPMDPAFAKALKESKQELANLRQVIEMLANRPVPQPTTIITPQTVTPPMKMEKGPQLTKAQLFNGIKRYLNPTMVTLLRMELFAGSADRPWKSDEKALAVDLLSIGANVYDHFAQEFRFRLPPVSEAEQWKESGEIDADDAC